MNLLRITIFCMICFATFSTVKASDFEAALSKETAQFTFRSDSSVIGWGGADLSLGLFYNEESDYVIQGGLLQMRQPSEQNPLTFGVGVKGYLGQLDKPDKDVFAFAVGGQVRYTIAGTMPMAVFLEGFFAPEITSFSDSDAIIDYTFGFQIEALPQTVAFIGVRHFEIELDRADYEADDDNVHFGVRLTF
ncbi:MAG: YfaZ family outer membrane protein [Gammaproteobacteria bacterium]|nr:YfaZ family outer membrane protein [Gammaproteobacteria bacterium]MDH3446673.1 YfaZ family outer membrane protein [Gammaproteobacteria bacterium]